MSRVIHAITPGDHYSPRTGSAIPTVVNGLAAAARRDVREPQFDQAVVLGQNTFLPRYDSATAIEFSDVPSPSSVDRIRDAVLARAAISRRAAARYFQPVAEALSHEPPAFVLAHNAPILPWLLRNSPHKVVLYAHNDILRTVGHSEANRTLGGVAGIICVSDFLADQTRRHLPRGLRDRVYSVGNGVDCVQFQPRVVGESRRRLRVIFVGRMVALKGPDVLLAAAARLRRNDVEIVLVGSHGFDRNASLTAYERRLRALAAASGVPVSFEPFSERERLADLLRASDIMVVPSRWQEPSGLTVGEGMASGLPVIASRVGGVPEVIGSAGILVPCEDPEALARSISELADNPELRRRISIAARQHATEHDWSWAWSNLRGVLTGLGSP
jgi:glycosyltransferase involved in cell wall biosynthesis